MLHYELIYLKGQVLANLKALDSDFFAKNYMNLPQKVRLACFVYHRLPSLTLKLD